MMTRRRSRPYLTTTAPAIRRAFSQLMQDWLSVTLLAVATVGLGMVWLWFTQNYETFPDLLALHFDAVGNPDRIAERAELWVLPQLALAVYLFNIPFGLGLRLLARMVFAPYLLWSGAIVVQILVAFALWNVTR